MLKYNNSNYYEKKKNDLLQASQECYCEVIININ